MSNGNGKWKLWPEGEPFSHRFTATLSDDGNTITGHWEIAEGGTNYTTDFDLIYRGVDWRLTTLGGAGAVNATTATSCPWSVTSRRSTQRPR